MEDCIVSFDVMAQIECFGYQIKGGYIRIHVIGLMLKKIKFMQCYKRIESIYLIIKTQILYCIILLLRHPLLYCIAAVTYKKGKEIYTAKERNPTESIKKHMMFTALVASCLLLVYTSFVYPCTKNFVNATIQCCISCLFGWKCFVTVDRRPININIIIRYLLSTFEH